MLVFKPVASDMQNLIRGYTFKYGEGSCQHSFVSSFCLAHKYGDMFCEQDNFLYTLRSNLCDEKFRVYLFPHGDKDNLQAVKNAVEKILDDAHENNTRVKFLTLTKNSVDLLFKLFPEKFTAVPDRNSAEYICDFDSQVNIKGSKLAVKRNKINGFFRNYGDKFSVALIENEHIEKIREFQKAWLEEKILRNSDPYHIAQLKNEDNGIQTALDNFFDIGLTGVVVFIDGELCGYAYGALRGARRQTSKILPYNGQRYKAYRRL